MKLLLNSRAEGQGIRRDEAAAVGARSVAAAGRDQRQPDEAFPGDERAEDPISRVHGACGARPEDVGLLIRRRCVGAV